MRYILAIIPATFLLIALIILLTAPSLTADEAPTPSVITTETNASLALAPSTSKPTTTAQAQPATPTQPNTNDQPATSNQSQNNPAANTKQDAPENKIWVSSSPGSTKPFALIQLFTSEGCSSCPPADLLLKQLTDQAEAEREPVYPLAFHVDYWNNRRFRDPYSSAEYSNLQKQYARTWYASNVYTPQMIVNGFEGFVGSNAQLANQQVNLALTTGPQYLISVLAETKPQSPNKTKISWLISPLRPKNKVPLNLIIAVSEDNLVNKINAGENRGRTLYHTAVVRAYKTIPLNSKTVHSHTEITLPADVKPDNTDITIYIQDPKTMGILAATRIIYPTEFGAEQQ